MDQGVKISREEIDRRRCLGEFRVAPVLLSGPRHCNHEHHLIQLSVGRSTPTSAYQRLQGSLLILRHCLPFFADSPAMLISYFIYCSCFAENEFCNGQRFVSPK